ncbi:MerR family transcriptional regulator [Nitratidesulfovibrio sp. 1201_IL3209]|uniref:MerR family transcriptional regulator n=1 Tax=Nitratidesulfovibrio sp. 1201_IL3209 TaxID=3084053 RepID=UPI002FDA9D07
MIREMLTLREIARRLDVPPSSIAYYKDRFARFLPAGEGRGRRLRYPVHVLDIFREIRSMYTRNVAAEQIEERLEELVAALSASVGQSGQPAGQPGARSGARPSGTGAEPHLRDRFRASDGAPGMDRPLDAAPRMADGPAPDPAVEGLPGMLDRMATLLQVQGHMLAELSSLRRQVEELRADRDTLLAAFDERAARLDEALELLRRERTEAVTRLVDDYYTVVSEPAGAGPAGAEAGGAEGTTGNGTHTDAAGAGRNASGQDASGADAPEDGASGADASDSTSKTKSGDARAASGQDSVTTPPATLFDLPLVIRRNSEYLGVSGRDKAFTLRKLLALVDRHAARRHRVGMDWGRSGSAWVLRLTTDEPASGRQGGSRTHELTLQLVTTPSGNHVTRLSRLAINGDTVPDRFLLELFRNIKESYESR